MMDKVCAELVEGLVRHLRYSARGTTVSFSLFVNCEGSSVEIRDRTPEDLKASGISMRNLRGEFITAETQS